MVLAALGRPADNAGKIFLMCLLVYKPEFDEVVDVSLPLEKIIFWYSVADTLTSQKVCGGDIMLLFEALNVLLDFLYGEIGLVKMSLTACRHTDSLCWANLLVQLIDANEPAWRCQGLFPRFTLTA